MRRLKWVKCTFLEHHKGCPELGTIGRGRLGLQILGASRMRCKAGEHRKAVSRDDTLAFDYKAPRPMLKEMPC